MNEEQQFDSDSSDDDYVPSGGEGVSEEEHSGDEEDIALLAEDGPADTVNDGKGKRQKSKKQKKGATSRKRQGGIKLEEEGAASESGVKENGETASDDYNKQLVESIEQEKVEKKEEDEKKKADSLWSDFMKDVGGPVSKPKPAAGGLGTICGSAKSSPKCAAASSSSSQSPASSSSSSHKPTKVTITQEFDFAGETVKVMKEVDANSKEAKDIKNKGEDPQQKTNMRPTAGPSLSALGGGIKRPGGGIGSVLGKIQKKPKMSTLIKSKLDWDNYKKDEGIEDELQVHNRGKEGYIERQRFLQRTDLRQFEIEKDMRNKNRQPFLS